MSCWHKLMPEKHDHWCKNCYFIVDKYCQCCHGLHPNKSFSKVKSTGIHVWKIAPLSRKPCLVRVKLDKLINQRHDHKYSCRILNRNRLFAKGYGNSQWPNNAIWLHWYRSTLAQVMACCLTASNTRLDQCWLYPSHSEVVGGVILVSLRPSVRPFVRPSVPHPVSVASTVLIGTISYLYILSSDFRGCVACKVHCQIKQFEFLAFFFQICNFDFVLFSLVIWFESLVLVNMGQRGYLRTQAF